MADHNPLPDRPVSPLWVYAPSTSGKRVIAGIAIVLLIILASNSAPQIFSICLASVTTSILLSTRNQPTSLWTKIRPRLAETLLIVSGVSALFCLLQLYLSFADFTPNDLATAHTIETNLIELHSLTKPFLDPSPTIVFGIVLLLVLLPIVFPLLPANRLLKSYSRYALWAHRIYIIVASLASFTLFSGYQVHQAAGLEIAMKAKLDEIHEGFREYQDKARKIAIHEAAVLALRQRAPELKLEFWHDYSNYAEQADETVKNEHLARYDGAPFSFQGKEGRFWKGYEEVAKSVDESREKQTSTESTLYENDSKSSLDAGNEAAAGYLKGVREEEGGRFDDLLDAAIDVANDKTIEKTLDRFFEHSIDINVEFLGLLYKPLVEESSKNWMSGLVKSLLTSLSNARPVQTVITEYEASHPLPACKTCDSSSSTKVVMNVTEGIQQAAIEASLFSESARQELREEGQMLDEKSRELGFPQPKAPWDRLLTAMEIGAAERKFNTKDPDLQTQLVGVVDNWVAYRRALEQQWIDNSQPRDQTSFERLFFNYCASVDPRMAALWGWIVKSTPEAEDYIRIRHPEFIPRIEETGMIPEFGFLYYAESERLADQTIIDHLFKAPKTSDFIGGVCDRLGG